MFTSNFTFLEKEYPLLYRLGKLAEKNTFEDPSTTLTKLRILSEKITLMLGEFEGFHDFASLKQYDRLKALEHTSVIFYIIYEKVVIKVHMQVKLPAQKPDLCYEKPFTSVYGFMNFMRKKILT